MRSQLIAIIATGFALTQAFQFPEGVDNGVYAIRANDAGEEHAVYLGPLNTTETKRMRSRTPAELQPRRTPQSGCTGNALSHADCDSVTHSLENYCAGGAHYYDAKMAWVSNGVVAYTCDYSGGQTCTSSEAASGFQEVTNFCSR